MRSKKEIQKKIEEIKNEIDKGTFVSQRNLPLYKREIETLQWVISKIKHYPPTGRFGLYTYKGALEFFGENGTEQTQQTQMKLRGAFGDLKKFQEWKRYQRKIRAEKAMKTNG